jgi:hypothetical protein
MSDEAPWLDEAEMATWLALIGVVMRLPGALEVQLRRDAGLNHFEYCVHVARRLESEGLIERFACPDDGRSTLARLTADGRERLAKAAPGHVRLVRNLVFDELNDEEMRQMGDLARRVLARIQA